jgi:hypothetical protein
LAQYLLVWLDQQIDIDRQWRRPTTVRAIATQRHYWHTIVGGTLLLVDTTTGDTIVAQYRLSILLVQYCRLILLLDELLVNICGQFSG